MTLAAVVLAACSPQTSISDGGSGGGAGGSSGSDAGGNRGTLYALSIGSGRAELVEVLPDGGLAPPVAQHAVEGVSSTVTCDPFTRSVGVVAEYRSTNEARYVRLWTDGGSSQSALLNPALNWSGDLHVRADGTTVGITWEGDIDGGREKLFVLDPSSAATTFVADLPGLNFVVYRSPAMSVDRRTVWLLGVELIGTDLQLYRIDAFDGGMLRSPPIPRQAFLAGVRGDGVGLALVSGDDAGLKVATLEPSTGQLTELGLAGFSSISGDSAYDPVGDRLYVITRDAIAVLDGHSGAQLQVIPLSASRSWVGLAVLPP